MVNNYIPGLAVSNSITRAQSTNIPNDFSYLPVGWKIGDSYTAAASFTGANDPKFKNAPVPLPQGYYLVAVSAVGNYNFRLQSNSLCIGKGYTDFNPKGDVPVNNKYGVTQLTPPGKDLGAYQLDGTGNQH